MSERSKPEPSDAVVLVWSLCNGWMITPATTPGPPRCISPGGSVRLPDDAMIDVRKDYAAAHPPEWTEKSVLAVHDYNTAGDALGVKSMASEIAAFRNAARDEASG